MKNNTDTDTNINLDKKTNIPQNINILNLAFSLSSLGFLMGFKLVDLLFYGTIKISVLDFLAITISTLGSILSLTYLKFKAGLIEEGITATLSTISLFLCGSALFISNNPLNKHINIFFGTSLIFYLGLFIIFVTNRAGLDIKENEAPNNFWNLIAVSSSGIVTIITIQYVNYISEKYYNDTLSIGVGAILVILGAIYTIIAAIYIKKIIIKYKSK